MLLFLYDKDVQQKDLKLKAGVSEGDFYIPPKCSKCGEYLYLAEDSKVTQCFKCRNLSMVSRTKSLSKRIR